MGAIPPWYRLLRAARYLGVAPWELATRPAVWAEWALQASYAEQQAEEQVRQRERDRTMGGRGR